MLRLEVQHLQQRELGAHVCIHDEKGLRAARQDLIPEVIHAPACPQGCVLLEVPGSTAVTLSYRKPTSFNINGIQSNKEK